MASPANIIKGGKGTFTEDHRAVFPAYFYVWIFKPVGNKIFKVVFHENDSTTKLKRQGGICNCSFILKYNGNKRNSLSDQKSIKRFCIKY